MYFTHSKQEEGRFNVKLTHLLPLDIRSNKLRINGDTSSTSTIQQAIPAQNAAQEKPTNRK